MAVVFIIVAVAGFLIYEAYRGGFSSAMLQGIPNPLGGLSMYTYSDLLTIAQNAGFSGNDAITAAAIAMAESSGNPRAYNPETAAGAPDGKGSYGLWQIYLHVHPEFEGEDLYDAQVNANAAYSVWSNAGASFAPWSTYKNGAYSAFLPSCCGGVSCNA